MQNLLISLGADIDLQEHCRNIARQANNSGKESEMWSTLFNRYNQLLIAKDYKNLENEYQNLVKSKERTPGGFWKQAIFYRKLNYFLSDTRDPSYWEERESRAQEWIKQFPKSRAAKFFLANIYYRRATAVRGDKAGNEVSAETWNEVRKWGEQAHKVLILEKEYLSKDPHWYKLMLNLIPFSHRPTYEAKKYLEEGMARYPNYHEMYFKAAFFLQTKWYGAPDDIDKLAQKMKVVKGNKELTSGYARLYWSLDQDIYHGKLFEQSQVKWNDMRRSFDDLIKLYPDPWNRNAYAYFACKAQDYSTMDKQVKLLDNQVIGEAWGGSNVYQDCVMPLATAEEKQKHVDLSAAQRALKEEDIVYNNNIWHAINLNKNYRYKESLDYFKIAQDIDRKRGRVWVITQYNLGVALLNLERYQEALMEFDVGLTEQKYFGYYFKKGIALELLGRKEEARAKLMPFEKNEKKDVVEICQKLADYGLIAMSCDVAISLAK
jgi:hypothetical protein